MATSIVLKPVSYCLKLLQASYSGHKDYVHCVCLRSGSCQFISGAEDGTVRIWGEVCPVHSPPPAWKTTAWSFSLHRSIQFEKPSTCY